jgi:hypothetical protein
MALIDSEDQQNQNQKENKDQHRAAPETATETTTGSNSVTYCTHFISSFANGIPSLPYYATLLEDVTKIILAALGLQQMHIQPRHPFRYRPTNHSVTRRPLLPDYPTTCLAPIKGNS